MASPIVYDQAFVYLDGALQAENVTVETSLEADDQDAMTIPKGWAGITPSPTRRMVTATVLAPITGFEYPYEQKFFDRQKVKLAIQLGGSGKKMSSEGFFRNVKLNAGVGKTLEVTFEFHGEPSIFE